MIYRALSHGCVRINLFLIESNALCGLYIVLNYPIYLVQKEPSVMVY